MSAETSVELRDIGGGAPGALLGEFVVVIMGLLASRLSAGHGAASLALRNPDDLASWETCLDDAATASVSFSVNGIESDVVLPLTDVSRLVRSGGRVVEIGAPRTGAVAWSGMALCDPYVVAAIDLSGLGRLSASRVPWDSGKTLGRHLQAVAERSGVKQVNERRKKTMQQLYREYGNEAPGHLANRIADGARIETIIQYYTELNPTSWVVLESGDQIAGGEAKLPAKGHLPDLILDALSVEAYGATRPHLPRAQGWKRRLEASPNPDGLLERMAGAQLLGDWTLDQRGHDPTGWLATALASGSATVSMAAAAGLPPSSWLVPWRKAGLTDRQVAVLVGNQMGFTDTEIGDLLKIANSTVRNTLSTARRKIRAISESE